MLCSLKVPTRRPTQADDPEDDTVLRLTSTPQPPNASGGKRVPATRTELFGKADDDAVRLLGRKAELGTHHVRNRNRRWLCTERD